MTTSQFISTSKEIQCLPKLNGIVKAFASCQSANISDCLIADTSWVQSWVTKIPEETPALHRTPPPPPPHASPVRTPLPLLSPRPVSLPPSNGTCSPSSSLKGALLQPTFSSQQPRIKPSSTKLSRPCYTYTELFIFPPPHPLNLPKFARENNINCQFTVGQFTSYISS